MRRRDFLSAAAAVPLSLGVRSPTIVSRGLVVSSQPLASQVGLDILQTGGNAADAAIATAAALCVLEPMQAGLGGDVLAIHADASLGELFGLRAAGADRPVGRLGPTDATSPDRLAGIPGAVDGWVALHSRFGGKPLAEILSPAIDLADRGVPVAPKSAAAWRRAAATIRPADPAAVEPLLPGGEPPEVGQVVAQPGLAGTLRLVALRGRSPVYEGELAGPILQAINARLREPDHFGPDDLVQQHAVWSTPLSVRYRGRDVFALPSATATLQTLLMLADYDLRSMGLQSASTMHLLVESMKVAVGDDGERSVRLDATAASQGRRRVNPNQGGANPDPRLRTRADLTPASSTGVVAIDADGNQCSLAMTLGRPFGSGRGPNGTGLLLKSSSGWLPVPIMVRDPDAKIPEIAAVVCEPSAELVAASLVVALTDFGLPIDEAIDAARVCLGSGTELFVEPALPEGVRRELARRGHRLFERSAIGAVQVARRQPIRKTLYGRSDDRTDGSAAGY